MLHPVLFGLALRQTIGLVELILQLCGLAWPVSDFSTLCRRQQDLNVQIPYSRSKAGLHLLVDSTGIKFLGEGEWKCKKHGAEYRCQWRKLHIGIDADRAICVTSNNVSDASVLCHLLVSIRSKSTRCSHNKTSTDSHPKLTTFSVQKRCRTYLAGQS